MSFFVAIRNPQTGREYLHGEEYADQWPDGNVPFPWPTRELADAVARDCRERLGRDAQVIPAEVQYADGSD